MGEDPKLFDAGDYNLFRYCHNDPVDNVDPMGTGWLNAGIPSLERLWDMTKWFDRSNIIQGLFPGFQYMSGQSDRDAKGISGPPITGRGRLLVDTDGKGSSHSDDVASAMMDPQGHLLPRDPKLVGRNGYRDLNADIDPYVVLPRDLNGIVRIGDRATVVLRDGRWQPGRLGDVGPARRDGEVSVAFGAGFGYQPLRVINPKTGRPEVDFSPDGRRTPDIPAKVIYYPGTSGL